MKNNDFEFIKQRFDAASVDIPDELDNRVQSKLNNVRPVKISFRQTNAFKAGMSIAACIAVFVMVVTTINISDIDYRIKSEDNSPSSATQLENFDNYKNVKKYIKDSQKKEKQNAIKSRIKSAVSPELIEYMDASQATKADSFDSAETYVQEKGVADAVSLMLCDELPNKATLETLDLSMVSDIKRPKGGGLEIKFFDRLKALDRLCEISSAVQSKSSSDFLSALENSAKALHPDGADGE